MSGALQGGGKVNRLTNLYSATGGKPGSKLETRYRGSLSRALLFVPRGA